MIVHQIVPRLENQVSLKELCDEDFFSQPCEKALSSKNIGFFDDLSREIFKNSETKQYPELHALAFWLRKSNLTSIVKTFKESLQSSDIIVPRGLALHIAPANVDSIFLYSWALSMLAGNINIVRVSQKQSDQILLLFQIIREIFQEYLYQEFAQKNIVLTYEHDQAISSYLSQKAVIRFLWGGDETIQLFRSYLTKPNTKDVTFVDKFSYCAINAAVYSKLEKTQSSELAHLFYNDAYWFDQMACSSPRVVYFVGSIKDCEKASKQFWQFLKEELRIMNAADTMSIAMNKQVLAYQCAMDGMEILPPFNPKHDEPTLIRVNPSQGRIPEAHCGGGFFFECFVKEIQELIPLVSPKDQTLTHFGFEEESMREFILSLNGKGIDRIVPIGQALNFSSTWDGYDLLNELTKRVVFK